MAASGSCIWQQQGAAEMLGACPWVVRSNVGARRELQFHTGTYLVVNRTVRKGPNAVCLLVIVVGMGPTGVVLHTHLPW